MRLKSLLCCLLLAGAALPLHAQDTQPEKADEQVSAPSRVILIVNRNVQVSGHLVLEDEDVITVRNTKGELESFAKTRLLQIVRLVDPEPDQTGMVVMRDGSMREGIIVEDVFDHVLIEIKGIHAKLKRESVSHVVLQPTVEQRYLEAKAALQPGMYDAHLALCRWLVEQRRYESAHQELLELLHKVEMPDARDLLKLVEAQLALAERPKRAARLENPEPEAPGEDDGRRAGPVDPADLMPSQLVSRDDVNIMRVYEIDFDHPPRVTITPDTVRTLIEKYGTSKLIPASQTGRNAMFRAAADKPIDLVRLMFELKARDLYPQIKVNSEPYALNMFRQRVHDTWLMNNCATSRCHGGPFAGDLFLHRRNFKDDRVRYTNMLILERLQLDPEWPLINFERPEDSLIIQYGLPREAARKPHPKVDGWKPAFSPIHQKLKEDTVGWISAMMQPRPDYTVKYDPPRLARKQDEPGAPEDANRPSR
ncbi:MAG: hypothetical protein L0Y44_12300 [Phycisphaerales bacterium]|nr:hypothetical protein [Phycisphaerales bacterium]MCI0631422.1 hypothetical protein [Phycisphaerales bacterium]MCI0676968.1 hypothetical protein [Phycisphaerales bacterium]